MAAQAILGAALGASLGSAAIAVGRGVLAATGDGLSFAAELLKTAGGTPTEVASAPDELAKQISALADRIRRHLAAAGIQLTESVEIVADGLGGMTVAGKHPQRAEIEGALAADLTLESEFQRLAVEYGEAGLSIFVPAAAR